MFNFFQKKSIVSPEATALNDLQRLEAEGRAGNKILKLHFGCGPRILKDWINIDMYYCYYGDGPYLKSYTDEHYGPEVRGDKKDFYAIDVTKQKLPLPDESVDVIFHEDFIEHIDQKGQILFLSEAFRILKKGGVHRLNTPDLASSMKKYSNFRMGYVGVYQDEWDRHTHKNILTKQSLEEIALMIGYSKIIFNSKGRSVSDLMPTEYRPGDGRPLDGNIFADLIK
jgi:SAM-dependent methyltransferase